MTIVESVSWSGVVVGCHPCRDGSNGYCAATGKDMWSLGHTSENVSIVGSISMGTNASSSGLALMFVAGPSMWLTCVSAGTTTLVSYNLVEDNGTKPPGFDGPKSLDEVEVETEATS